MITLRCPWSCGHQGSASFPYTDRQFWSCEGRCLSTVLKSCISFFLTSCLNPCSSKSHLLLAQKIPTPSSVMQSSPGITSVPQFRSWSNSTTPIITSDTHSKIPDANQVSFHDLPLSWKSCVPHICPFHRPERY